MVVKPSEIAVVDLSSLSGKYEELGSESFDKFAEEFGDAMSTIGFAYVVNHGVDMKKIDVIHDISKKFFLLPSSVKNKYSKSNPAECFHGYAGPGEELLNKEAKNSTELREFYDIWGFQQYEESQFPVEISGYKAAIDGIRDEINNLGKKLLRGLGTYLKAKGCCLEDPSFFVKAHTFMDNPKIKTQSQYRALHYYQMDPTDPTIPTDAIRCGEHSDWGTITLLFQDMIGGLEVKRLDGSWIDAVPIQDAILINAAQLLELWTAGMFPATFHRVRIVDEERIRKMARQSFIYFINPDGDRVVSPIVPCPPGDEKWWKVEPKVAYDHYYNSIGEAVARVKKANGTEALEAQEIQSKLIIQ